MTQARAVLACACLWLAGYGIIAQPLSCLDDNHCHPGLYCQMDVHLCRECLRCEDLKREPPPMFVSCIKSVAECGSCSNGLVEDHQGDLNSQCVPPGAMPSGTGFPTYGWVLVAVLLLVVLLLFAGIVWYALKHPDTLKILASTSASMQSRCESTVVPASAPANPPPYNALYAPVRPSSPPEPTVLPVANDFNSHIHDEESAHPFIKFEPTSLPHNPRESAGSQAARVFNNPAYVRGPQLPPSYESAAVNGDIDSPFTDHDEETMESTWTPSNVADLNHNTNNGSVISNGETGGAAAGPGGELPALLQAARGTSLIQTPYADRTSQTCLRQDSNNNGSRDAGESSYGCGDPGSGSTSAHNTPSFIINVMQTINTVQQRSNVSH